jgi:hypothetical protein
MMEKKELQVFDEHDLSSLELLCFTCNDICGAYGDTPPIERGRRYPL